MKKIWIVILTMIAMLGLGAFVLPTSNNYGQQPLHFNTAATLVVKGTPGVLHSFIVGTPVASTTVSFYDIAAAGCTGTPAAGNLVSKMTFPTTPAPFAMRPDWNFELGICLLSSGASDVTVATE